MTTEPDILSIRLDTWLFASRFFKTRSAARQAIQGGKVRYNGMRPKPSTRVTIQAQVLIQQGHIEKEVIICQLANKRGPAKQAMLLYQETPTSCQKREQYLTLRKLTQTAKPSKRPDKKSRRQLIAIKHGEYHPKDDT